MTQEAGVDDGALLRLPIDGTAWTEEVPPAPSGPPVTVSLHSPDTMRDRAALESLGYRVVSARPVAGRSPGTAEFLVPVALPLRYPQWWRTLTALAEQVFDLACGPVQSALADVLRLHVAGAAGTDGSGRSRLNAFQ